VSGQQQLGFDWLPVVPVEAGKNIEEDFRAFHKANPHIYRILRKMALEYKRAGNEHCGIKMLWEALRYNSGIRTRGDAYKLNNNYTAHYARLLMDQERELRGFFETRERAD